MTKILVIEDDKNILENIIEILRLEDFDVRGEPNGKLGLKTAIEFLPDLIICDISMPEMNGYEVLNKVREHRDLLTVPFVFLSAFASKPEIRKGMTLGADDYLTKPFHATELLEMVHAQLGKRAALAQAYGQQLNSLRQNIIYALPHELRTPLYGISGYATLLMEDYESISPKQIMEIAEYIYTSAARLNDLIEKHLLYAQIELLANDPNRLRQLRSACTLNAGQTVELTAVELAQRSKRKQDLKLSTGEVAAAISEESLSKISYELIENAFKFSKKGTPVEVSIENVETSFTLNVTDYGHGMTAEQIANIGAYMQFERKLYEQQGTGLGLVIAKRLTELHGGQMTIESVPGDYTTIRTMLPVANTTA
jgi:two-component system, sensor histidine kinase and response regulator